MSKHTAFFSAPCRVDGARVYDTSGNLVATVAYRRDPAEEAMAANLIAAEPELLEALKEELRLRLLGQQPDVHWESLRDERRRVYAQTEAAIAKATGGTQ